MSLHKSTTRDYKKINFKEVMYTHFMTCRAQHLNSVSGTLLVNGTVLISGAFQILILWCHNNVMKPLVEIEIIYPILSTGAE